MPRRRAVNFGGLAGGAEAWRGGDDDDDDDDDIDDDDIDDDIDDDDGRQRRGGLSPRHGKPYNRCHP